MIAEHREDAERGPQPGEGGGGPFDMDVPLVDEVAGEDDQVRLLGVRQVDRLVEIERRDLMAAVKVGEVGDAEPGERRRQAADRQLDLVDFEPGRLDGDGVMEMGQAPADPARETAAPIVVRIAFRLWTEESEHVRQHGTRMAPCARFRRGDGDFRRAWGRLEKAGPRGKPASSAEDVYSGGAVVFFLVVVIIVVIVEVIIVVEIFLVVVEILIVVVEILIVVVEIFVIEIVFFEIVFFLVVVEIVVLFVVAEVIVVFVLVFFLLVAEVVIVAFLALVVAVGTLARDELADAGTAGACRGSAGSFAARGSTTRPARRKPGPSSCQRPFLDPH